MEGNRGSGRSFRALLLVLVVALGCTGQEPAPQPTPSPEPTPNASPSGLRVGVVTPLVADVDPWIAEEIAAGLEEFAAERAGDITRLRVVEAGEAQFVEDVAALLADDGAELVCVLGSGAAGAVVELAPRYPATRFCAAPAVLTEPPDNVDGAVLATDELGHAVGVAARELVGEDGTVAVVTGEDRGDRDRFATGLRAGLTGVDAILALSVDDASSASDAGEEVLDAEVDLVIVDLHPEVAEPLFERLDDEVPLVVSHAARGALDDDVTPLLSFGPRWSQVVVAAVERALDPERPVPPAIGFGGSAFDLDVDALPATVADVLAATIEDLRRGDRDPTAPPPGSTAPLEPDDEDDDGDDDGDDGDGAPDDPTDDDG